MAGAIWGAFNGIEKIDNALINKLEKGQTILEKANELYEKSVSQGQRKTKSLMKIETTDCTDYADLKKTTRSK